MMNAKQYRDALEKLDLTQSAAGRMFGVDSRTSRRWALGGAKIPPLVAMLLELMVDKKVEIELEIPASPERSRAERRLWTFRAKQAVHAMESE